jgi:glucose/mannose-6-phosphate isomerase
MLDPLVLLDNPEELARHDPSGMLELVEGAADQWQGARAAASRFEPPARWRDLKRVVIAGMGGSAIAADIAAAWLSRRWPVSVQIVRDYTLPAWVDEETLLVASSYSGTTEETLAVWEQARRRGLPRAALTTGGELGRLAEQEGIPMLRLPPGYPPRAALPTGLASLLRLLEAVGPADQRGPGGEEALEEIGEAGRVLLAGRDHYGRARPVADNPAKQLALWLDRGLPILYAPDYPLGPVAVRWRGQLSENAKRLTGGHMLPEMNHNEIVGWQAQPDLYPATRVILLEDEQAGERQQLRSTITAGLIEEAGGLVQRLSGTGKGLLARMMSLVMLGDYTSVYLASAWEIDPTPVASIDFLKSQLARGNT